MPDFERLKDLKEELPDPRLMRLALSMGVAIGAGGATIEKYQSTGLDEWQIAIGGIVAFLGTRSAVKNWNDLHEEFK